MIIKGILKIIINGYCNKNNPDNSKMWKYQHHKRVTRTLKNQKLLTADMKRYMTIPEKYRKTTKNSLRRRYEIPEKRFCNCYKELNYLHNMILGILP